MINEKGMTTEDHAVQISESILNGQNKQALDQFERALNDHCNPSSLLADIAEGIGAGRALIHIAAAYIERKHK